GLKPIKLKAKEGLALINGTQLMNAYLCFAIHDIHNLLKNAQIAGIMSLEALKGTDQAFRKDIQKLRPHEGQKKSAENLWNLLRGSEILKSHRDCPKVQDPYTLRCMPQVFGAVYDALDFARKIAEVEMNSVTDNPIILRESGDVVSGGNFHGQNLAMVLDFLSIATSYLGSFSERRIARLVDSKLSELPPFLTDKGGLHSGFMMPHYLAASLVNENKILSHPASVDTIPVSANQEDFVSMGANAGKKLMKIIDNVQTIIAIEYLASAQALEFLKPLKPSRAIQIAFNHIRKRIQKLDVDRAMYRDIEMMKNMVKSGEIVRAVEKEVKLH
ncbi:MAG TPA: histidine ammonia-lyase, partial [Thermoplasmatales archaeon]|nr:histidine ammonia-lyase [Thermoplasmatales archaeon]